MRWRVSVPPVQMSGSGLEFAASSLEVAASINVRTPATASSGCNSSRFAELAATTVWPRAFNSATSRSASRNGLRRGRNRSAKISLRRLAMADPAGESSSKPLTAGISLSPPIPMQRRAWAKSTAMPCSSNEATHACAWASLLSTKVPSTSRSTAFTEGTWIVQPLWSRAESRRDCHPYQRLHTLDRHP